MNVSAESLLLSLRVLQFVTESLSAHLNLVCTQTVSETNLLDCLSVRLGQSGSPRLDAAVSLGHNVPALAADQLHKLLELSFYRH